MGVKVLRYEIKNITPPADILAAMEKQMRAEREKRAVILTSEGTRDAAINTAEGMKQEVIKQSEARKQQQINEAEGEPPPSVGRDRDGRGDPQRCRSDQAPGGQEAVTARRRAVHRAVRQAGEEGQHHGPAGQRGGCRSDDRASDEIGSERELKVGSEESWSQGVEGVTKMANDGQCMITGATGKQGGATARALAGKGFALRAMTRHPESDAAKAIASATGAELVRGDLNDAASLKDALKGTWGVFAVQNTWEAGVEGEEEQGKRIATVAREAGVQHFVYSSVGSAHRKTGIPHFDNKYRVEDTIRGLGFPSHVILRPVFFMENLPSPWFVTATTCMRRCRPRSSCR